jgi:hypothetical protein
MPTKLLVTFMLFSTVLYINDGKVFWYHYSFPMATDPGQLSFQGPTFDNRATSRLCRVTSHNKQCPT